VLGLLSWLIVSAFQPAGLADFFTSTGTTHSDRPRAGPGIHALTRQLL